MPAPKYRLHANKVDRIAIVDRPCVPDAEIVLFKRLEDPVSKKEGLLPIADRLTKWYPEEALKRVKEWATDGDNFKKDGCSKAFMKTEPEHELQFADVIDGKLAAIPKSIFAIIQKLSWGMKDLADEERKKILDRCKSYYDALDLEFPYLVAKYFEKGMALDYNARVIPNLIGGAVEALFNSCCSIFYKDGSREEKIDLFKEEYENFRTVVSDILGLAKSLETRVQAQKLFTEEVVNEFTKELDSSATTDSFANFKGMLQGLFISHANLEDPEEVTVKVLDAFEEFVVTKVLGIPENLKILQEGFETANLTGRKKEPLEKIGRKISSARLKKLIDAMEVLKEIIAEAEGRIVNKNQKEAEEMELKELSDKLDKISADVGSISARMTNVENILKEHNMLLTDEEKKRIEAGKAEARKKAEEAEKKAQEAKALAEKAEKEKIIAEKKFKEEEKARLEKIEKELTEIGKVMEKRLGVKTSLEKDGGDKDTEKGDVFGDTLRGKS